jgi:putative solute:sodium symporter small subunit
LKTVAPTIFATSSTIVGLDGVPAAAVIRSTPTGNQLLQWGTVAMIQRNERKPYWRHTKMQMIASLLPFLMILVVFPLYAERLNSNKFLGFPLGYFLVGHGLIIIALFTIASYVNRQDAVDHWHGAHEDH